MAQEIPQLTIGFARPLDIQNLLTDEGLDLLTDTEVEICVNKDVELRYTNPNLHRRIDQEAEIPPGSDYKLVVYDAEGNPYKQHVKLGVLDGMNSYRVTETFIHDEESTTCEIP